MMFNAWNKIENYLSDTQIAKGSSLALVRGFTGLFFQIWKHSSKVFELF